MLYGKTNQQDNTRKNKSETNSNKGEKNEICSIQKNKQDTYLLKKLGKDYPQMHPKT